MVDQLLYEANLEVIEMRLYTRDSVIHLGFSKAIMVDREPVSR